MKVAAVGPLCTRVTPFEGSALSRDGERLGEGADEPRAAFPRCAGLPVPERAPAPLLGSRLWAQRAGQAYEKGSGCLCKGEAVTLERNSARQRAIEQYCILGRIGEGAHGIVFKAKHVEVSTQSFLRFL